MLNIAIIADNQSKQYFKDAENNSWVNTNNGDQDQRRLNKFVESKHIGTYFYLAPKRRVYYIFIEEQKLVTQELLSTNFIRCNLSKL